MNSDYPEGIVLDSEEEVYEESFEEFVPEPESERLALIAAASAGRRPILVDPRSKSPCSFRSPLPQGSMRILESPGHPLNLLPCDAEGLGPLTPRRYRALDHPNDRDRLGLREPEVRRDR